MKTFDILSRDQVIHRSHLLEASAGTGKTFAIENIVVRLLIENNPATNVPLTLEEILVVTFTRAATRDLKLRIRAAIEHALMCCRHVADNVPDYLLTIMEQGDEAIKAVQHNLEQALLNFDLAQIFTIHSFCSRMLREHMFEGDVGAIPVGETQPINDDEIVAIVRDYFRTELKGYSVEQLQAVLKAYRNDVKELEWEIVRILKKGVEIEHPEGSIENPEAIVSAMAHACQKLLCEYLANEEKLTFDDILRAMQRAAHNPKFASKVRSQYKAVIVDEFQDTDPIQWDIFRSLFHKVANVYIYLVGDPKQSIYSFRQADIYTYLSAAEALGADGRASLNTNYRSQPSLVHALNAIFHPEIAPELISLPRLQTSLSYHAVLPCTTIPEHDFNDGIGSVHFCLAHCEKYKLETAETDFFLPYFAHELSRLKSQFSLGRCAILVSDRYQGKRVGEFLQSCHIPVALQRTGYLSESPALPALRDCVRAVLHPHRHSEIKVALGSRLIGWTHEQVSALSSEQLFEEVVNLFVSLRRSLLTDGFAPFFQQLMRCCFPFSDKSVQERLLQMQGGAELQQDLEQIVQLVIAEEFNSHITGEGFIHFLDRMQLEEGENQRLKRQQDPNQDAVQVLTIHSSKGLEYDIVFALGLAARRKSVETVLPIHEGNTLRLKNTIEGGKEHLRYCEEVDAEAMRQLYVAMTRAKYRVYVPAIICQEQKSVPFAQASPMELFLARFMQPAVNSSKDLYERILPNSDLFLRQFIDRGTDNLKLSYVTLDKTAKYAFDKSENAVHDMVAPFSVRVPGTPRLMHSFTTLAKKKAHEDAAIKTKNLKTLPVGSDTGTLLHLLLEKIAFHQVAEMTRPEELLPFVRRHIPKSYEEWAHEIAQILFNACKVMFKAEDRSFRLCDIPEGQFYRETEFLYLLNEGSQEFLKGVIDLVFGYEGKYYLLDWKSNWLEEYSPGKLAEAMVENDYYLQESIYRQALRRYLRVVDNRPFDEIFGGSFYVFVRGLDLSQQSSPGILYIE